MKSRRITSIACLLVAVSLLARLGAAEQRTTGPRSYVTVDNRGRYFDVRIDYRRASAAGVSPYAIGREYGRRILALGLPIDSVYDAVVAETVGIMLQTGSIQEPAQAFAAVQQISPQIPWRYRSEIAGLASIVATAPVDEPGDGQLSLGELTFLHLVQDIFRAQCSGLSISPRRGERQPTATAFLMDFFGREAFGHLHAVTTIADGPRSLAMVGFLGLVNSTVSINDDGVFVGIPSSEVPTKYDAAGKRSVFFDVRAALERHSSLRGVAAAMMDPQKRYAQGFNLSLADRNGAAVLEVDNLGRRALRTAHSALNAGVDPWPFPSAVATVNSFVLDGNTDNHTTDPVNFERWRSYIDELAATGPTTTLDELRQIVSFDHGNGPDEFLAGTGDIYNQWTMTISVFVPQTRRLQVFFAPPEGPMPDDPEFVDVPLRF